MLFSEDTWEKWTSQVEDHFENKAYIHFDHPFDLPQRKAEIRDLFSIPGKLSSHSFLPLIKIITKTPRYKYEKPDESAPDFVEKENYYELATKKRPISFASHFDTYVYSYYSFALNETYQEYIKKKGFQDTVLAYRTDLNGKCNIQFAKEAFEIVKGKGQCTALALDIKGYFDSIDHTLLKKKWCKILGVDQLDDGEYALFKSLTKYSYIKQNSLIRHFDLQVKGKNIRKPKSYSNLLDGDSLIKKMNQLRAADLIVVNQSQDPPTGTGYKRYFGIPQGSSLSALLSNIYLVDFDEFMYQLGAEVGFVYRRYCDDILIIVDTAKAAEIQNLTIKKLEEEYYLKIQPDKVEIIDFRLNSKGKIRAFNGKKLLENDVTLNRENEDRFYKALQYLGFEFTGQKILIRNSSISRFMRKMRKRIVKTVSMAYGKSGYSHKIFKKRILQLYSHLGKQNFLSYAYRAASKEYKVRRGMMRGMDSPAIRKQVSKHFKIIFKSLNKKNQIRFMSKQLKGERVSFKEI